MEERGLNTNTLSKASGVSSGYISELLSGKKGEQMGIHVLRRLAKGLGVKASGLVRRIELISEEKNSASPKRVA